MYRRRVIVMMWVAAAWLVVGMFFFSQMYLLHPRTNRGFDAAGELAWQVTLSFV